MKKIYLYGVIGSEITDTEFISQIPDEGNEDLEIRINSPGGSVFQGWGIFNALNEYKGKKIIHIDGIAASMASVVALAGDEIYMSENSLFMIHNPSSHTRGSASDLRKEADLLDKIKVVMVDSYHKKTGLAKVNLEKMLDDETWFTAQEAKDNKFINAVKGKVLIQTGSVAGHDPMKIYGSFTNPINHDKIISELGMSSGSTENEILAKIKAYRQSEPTAEDKKKAHELVKVACLDKKITADLIPFYEVLAIKNYSDVESLFNGIPKLRPASETINENSGEIENRSKWSLDDYRMKDPKALKNKELFDRLLKEF